jgi:tetratricopeptide (TPR) repeat protein
MIALLSDLPHGTLTLNLELAHLLSWGLREAGEFRKSLDLQLELEPLFRARGNDWLLRAWLLVATGNHMFIGDIAQAREDSLECLDLASRVDDQYAIAWATNNLAAADAYTGRSSEALINLQRAAAANHKRGYLRGLALAFHNLGGVYCDLTDSKEALSNIQQATEYSRQIGDPLLLLWHDVARAEALLGLRDTELAVAILHPAETAFARAEMRFQQVNALLQLGVCTRLQGEPMTARGFLTRALKLSRDAGAELLSALVHIQLGLVSDASGDTQGAITSAGEAHQLLSRFGSTFYLDRNIEEFSSEVRAHLLRLTTAK